MNAIIIAAGEASRWKNYKGIPKHLIEIDGEPILHRTVRLLRENNVEKITVVGPQDDRYKIKGSELYVPKKNKAHVDADKFLNSESLWDTKGRTVVFYGDVYFTEKAIKTIVNHEGEDWILFCRFNASEFTGTRWGECFAQSFYPKDHGRHKSNLLLIAEEYKKGSIKRCGGWEHYRAMCNAPLDAKFHKDYGNSIVIDDWTDDFDYPKDYKRFVKFWNEKKSKSSHLKAKDTRSIKDKIVSILQNLYNKN
jgi:NDP-sugar pyrophosphorylase family protein